MAKTLIICPLEKISMIETYNELSLTSRKIFMPLGVFIQAYRNKFNISFIEALSLSMTDVDFNSCDNWIGTAPKSVDFEEVFCIKEDTTKGIEAFYSNELEAIECYTSKDATKVFNSVQEMENYFYSERGN